VSAAVPCFEDSHTVVYQGDARVVLREMEPESVQCVVTSPPYWSLRDYGIPPSVWGGEEHEHEWGEGIIENATNYTNKRRWQHTRNGRDEEQPTEKRVAWLRTDVDQGNICRLCGAWRGTLGLEPTPELYVAHMVEVFREVRRVLRKDGTVWLNMGDSYAHGQPGGGSVFDNGRTDGRKSYEADKARGREKTPTLAPGLKAKDLVGVPWRVAFALQADGWWLRSDIVWAKPNPMPESVTDRPTRAHEYVFLLTKSARYFYDAQAIAEPLAPASIERIQQANFDNQQGGPKDYSNGTNANRSARQSLVNLKARTLPPQIEAEPERWAHIKSRNKRSVWQIATQPYPLAHFATFPEALVTPCVLAGTSERGGCAECGAPWVRGMKPDAARAAQLGKGRG
jgi:DNA modification methylase